MKGNKIVLLLLIVSLVINSVFVYLVKFSAPEAIDNSRSVKVNQTLQDAYDFSKYDSVAYQNQKLSTRFNRLYEQYLKDKSQPNDTSSTDGVVDAGWNRQCQNNLRRIMVLSGDLQIIETTINSIIEKSDAPDAKNVFDVLVEAKGYHEKLADMSNFYAKFVSEEFYTRIQQSLD